MNNISSHDTGHVCDADGGAPAGVSSSHSPTSSLRCGGAPLAPSASLAALRRAVSVARRCARAARGISAGQRPAISGHRVRRASAAAVAAFVAGLGAPSPVADPPPAAAPSAGENLASPQAGVESVEGATVGPQRFFSPTTGDARRPVVLRAFDKPSQPWLPGHRGVDVELGVGEAVLSAADGIVAFAGVVAGTPVVSVDHPSGIRSTYQPVYAAVRAGDPVVAGQKLGTLAPSMDGYPGLHWGARVGRDYLNPLSLMPMPVIRLKPTPPEFAP